MAIYRTRKNTKNPPGGGARLCQTATIITGQQGKRPQTRPGAVLGCPGELEAQSRWVFKLARSFARSTPREDHQSDNRPAALGRRPLETGPAVHFSSLLQVGHQSRWYGPPKFSFLSFFKLLACIFHHFCKCDTNPRAPPHQNFRFHHF